MQVWPGVRFIFGCGAQMAPPLTLEEQTFLDDPLAIEACLSCGIELHELHTQTLSLSSHGHDIASMAEHAEKRRQMKWKLVREEHARLQRRQPAMASSASAGGLDTARMERLRKSQASNARMMLERQSRLMRQEMEAEARKERMELKQKMATANRESQQLLRARSQQETAIKRQVRSGPGHAACSAPSPSPSPSPSFLTPVR